ncbi:MAG: alpha-L-fucosidase [Bryobacteraceae bacterium]|nr:alpha-L-fucosidase [Bryobacteraceae bacterium]
MRFSFCLPFLLLTSLFAQSAPPVQPKRPSATTIQQWQSRKFGLFIHFGLYSELGGVWKGQQIEGYNEQIRLHAHISKDEYAAIAAQFNPSKWDPDSIVKLAQDAGMKFIVITSKHHDGFSMFHTRESKFNIVDATPYGQDIVKGLAAACARHGMKFGVYYSTIDWNDPRANGISQPPANENDNEIPKAHEDYNVAQLKELTTRYGPLSEIWFDMGRPTPAQSRRFAATVHAAQPECMVSGRVFNSQGDFTVMGDNELPTSVIDEPWQTPGSIYGETWGYRSWQERKDLAGKTNEHLLKLVEVVSRGGNYILNIGPRGDGTVVEFEADVLRGVGKWVKANAEAIYGTGAQPFRELDFGYATTKPGRLYLMVTKWPEDGQLKLPGLKSKLTRAYFLGDAAKKPLSVDNSGAAKIVRVESKPANSPVTVIVAEYAAPLRVIPPSVQAQASGVVVLDAKNATKEFNYNNQGYYEGPTVYKLRWDFAPSRAGKYSVAVTYRKNASTGPLEIATGAQTLPFVLKAGQGDEPASFAAGSVTFGTAESLRLTLTPKRPFQKGAKLGVTIDKVVLTPVK